jgi:hypothetical protein
VLGIYPNARGFGFALFEGTLSPLDWGVFETRGNEMNRRCLQRIAVLFNHQEPDILVLENMSEGGTRREKRIRDLNDAISVLAETQGIRIASFSRKQVRQCFGSEFTSKQMIAETIGKRIQIFARLVPPIRKPWKSEHARMGLFDAVALILTFHQSTDV